MSTNDNGIPVEHTNGTVPVPWQGYAQVVDRIKRGWRFEMFLGDANRPEFWLIFGPKLPDTATDADYDARQLVAITHANYKAQREAKANR